MKIFCRNNVYTCEMIFFNKLLLTFSINFAMQYFVFTSIMLNSLSDFTHNISKFYLSTIVGLVSMLLNIGMHKYTYNKLHTSLLAVVTLLLIVFVYLYRIQYAIDDNEYLKQLKENASGALLISKAMEFRTNTYEIAKISKNIVFNNQNRDFDKLL